MEKQDTAATVYTRTSPYTDILHAERAFTYRVLARAAVMRANVSLRAFGEQKRPLFLACPSCRSPHAEPPLHKGDTAAAVSDEHPLYRCAAPSCASPPWSPLTGECIRPTRTSTSVASLGERHHMRFDDPWLRWFYPIDIHWSSALMLLGVRRFHYREMMEWSSHRLGEMNRLTILFHAHNFLRGIYGGGAEQKRLEAAYAHLIRTRIHALPPQQFDLPDIMVGSTGVLLSLQMTMDETNECFVLERWYQTSTDILEKLPESLGGGSHGECTRCDSKPNERRHRSIEEERGVARWTKGGDDNDNDDGDDDDGKDAKGATRVAPMRRGSHVGGHRGGHRGKRRPWHRGRRQPARLFGRCASQHHWSTETGYRFPRVVQTDPTDIHNESARFVCNDALSPYHRLLFSWAHAHLARVYYTRLESIYSRLMIGAVRRPGDQATLLYSMFFVASIWNALPPAARPAL